MFITAHSLAESELSEVVNVDVTQLDHQQLFTKLFKEMLSYRLDQQVFSRVSVYSLSIRIYNIVSVLLTVMYASKISHDNAVT